MESLSMTGTSSSPSLDHFLHPPHHPPPAAQQNVVIPIVGFADSGIYLVPSVNNVASNNASNGSSSSGSAGEKEHLHYRVVHQVVHYLLLTSNKSHVTV